MLPLIQNLAANMMPSVPWELCLAQGAVDPANMPVLSGDIIAGHWTPVMLLPIILGAISYLLLQRGVIKSEGLTIIGILCLIVAMVFGVAFFPPSIEAWVLASFFALTVSGGISFLVAREPVYAALGFATAVLSTCGVLFMQSALFIAAATMIVYAGATIIIFLFVLMFAQQQTLRTYDVQLTNPYLAAIIGGVVLIAITLCVTGEGEILPVRVDLTRKMSLANPPADNDKIVSPRVETAESPKSNFVPKSTSGLGRSLYTDYLLAVELAGTVLLVATLGAMALAQRSPEGAS